MAYDYLRYANQNAIRNQPLSDELARSLAFLEDMGLTANVISGGQDPSGPNHTGGPRHNHGNAADIDIFRGDTKLDWNNPDHLPIVQEVVRRAKRSGAVGIGAGNDYMGPGRFHIGFGKPAVWGAGGKSANAPPWLQEAYASADAPDGGMDEKVYASLVDASPEAPHGTGTGSRMQEKKKEEPDEPDYAGAVQAGLNAMQTGDLSQLGPAMLAMKPQNGKGLLENAAENWASNKAALGNFASLFGGFA